MVPTGEARSWLRSRPIAHRGLHDAAAGRPENSLPAFLAARESGYPVELDVRLSADGKVVVVHDDRLERLTGVDVAVAGSSLASLQSLRLLGTGTTIPTLAEVLALLEGRVPLLIEIKNSEAPGPLEEALLADLDGYDGPNAVQSFNPLSLAWFRERAPGIPRGQLSGSFSDTVLDDGLRELLVGLRFNEMTEPAFIAYELGCLPHPAASAARAAGLPLIAWTVRTPEDLARAREHADNVIFESVLPPRMVTSA
jgi:glycerophosphoryl diester phosphodiesterase